MIAGGLIVLWAGTRFIPAPFENEIGEVDLGGIVTKLSELIGMIALLALAAHGKIGGLAKQSWSRLVTEAIILSFFIASLTYFGARGVEPGMPFLSGEEHQEQTQ
jgi:hypothetical protein